MLGYDAGPASQTVAHEWNDVSNSGPTAGIRSQDIALV